MVDHGLLDENAPIELVDGLLLVKEPQSSPHRTAALLTAQGRDLRARPRPALGGVPGPPRGSGGPGDHGASVVSPSRPRRGIDPRRRVATGVLLGDPGLYSRVNGALDLVVG